jgi:hypothetical protein
MKNLFLACFFIFSFEEAFSQTRFIDINKEEEGRHQELKKQSGDEVVTGQAATERKEVQKSESIQSVNCMDTRGQAYAPNSKGYKKCVDNANRVQKP